MACTREDAGAARPEALALVQATPARTEATPRNNGAGIDIHNGEPASAAPPTAAGGGIDHGTAGAGEGGRRSVADNARFGAQ